MPRHRHLLLRNLAEPSSEFRPYGGGTADHPSRVRDRVAHAGRLRKGLVEVAAAIEGQMPDQRSIGVPAVHCGTSVVVESRTGELLQTGDSLRAGSSRLRLLSVRRGADRLLRTGHDRGVYFVQTRMLPRLWRAIEAYEAWDGDDRIASGDAASDGQGTVSGLRKNRPSNFWLLESAASIRPALVEDLWTGALVDFPEAAAREEWEVWVRAKDAAYFAEAIRKLGLETVGRPSEFVDVEVHNVSASRSELARLIAMSAAVVELRPASNFIVEHADLLPAERLLQVEAIARRIVPPPDDAPLVTILDTGVNRAHPLLVPALPTARCGSIEAGWNRFDDDGHGTKMAGVALFGDLADVPTEGPVRLEIGLESVVVFDPASAVRVPARDAIRRGVSLVEGAGAHRRVFCLAATAVGEAEDGRPAATSSTLDRLAFNGGERSRLFCVAVGNVPSTPRQPYPVASYASLNREHGIESPAQAVNALSVGAATRKCSGPVPLAVEGGLSPRSRTAQAWVAAPPPHKPDILMEGGNHGIDPCGTISRPHGPDMVATTSRDPVRRPVALVGDTSAACAAAAGLAARLMASYPTMRAETVRALLVNNADWTQAMLDRRDAMIASGHTGTEASRFMLDCFGWGLPNEERVFWSANNALTLVLEDVIRPYRRHKGRISLKEMVAVRLPWPDEALRALRGDVPVEMRCTLSYFVEPDPHSAGLDRPALYHSHRLKFDFQRFEEDESTTLRRVNQAAAAAAATDMPDVGWLLGLGLRTRGTIHHDIWTGPAYQLVGRRLVTVTPLRGWWAENGARKPEDVPVPFSLVVSIRTPETEVDLMAEAMARAALPTLVRVPGG